MNELKLIDTHRHERQIGLRVGESVYQALERLARETGSTIADAARRVIIEGLNSKGITPDTYKAGDTLKVGTSDVMVIIAGDNLSGEDIKMKLKSFTGAGE